jgi:hypothetical protein
MSMLEAEGDADQIELESFVDDIADITDIGKLPIEPVNFEIAQTCKMHGSYRKLTVFKDCYCHQLINTKHRKPFEYRIDLTFLDPRPFRSRKRPWRWLIIALVLLGIDTVLLLAGFVNTSSINFLGLFVGLLVVGILSLLAFFYYSRDRVYFRTRYGRIKLVEVNNNRPNRKQFRDFLKQFVVQIKNTQATRGYSQSKSLARELKELRRLKDDKVIPEKSYEKAKQLIFRHEAFTKA